VLLKVAEPNQFDLDTFKTVDPHMFEAIDSNLLEASDLNPILHTVRLDIHTLTLKTSTAK